MTPGKQCQPPISVVAKSRTERFGDASAKLIWLIFGHELEALLDNHVLPFPLEPCCLGKGVGCLNEAFPSITIFSFCFVVQRVAGGPKSQGASDLAGRQGESHRPGPRCM